MRNLGLLNFPLSRSYILSASGDWVMPWIDHEEMKAFAGEAVRQAEPVWVRCEALLNRRPRRLRLPIVQLPRCQCQIGYTLFVA